MKFRAMLAALVAIALSTSAVADPGITRVPLGYQQITSLSAAASLTVPTGATMAMIGAEGQNVRYRDDGIAPTATVGMPVLKDTTIQYEGRLSAIQFIEQTSGGKINVSYYR